MRKHVVAAVAEIPAGGRKLVTVQGRPIVIFNLAGDFFGLMNRCPHQGADLCAGEVMPLISADQPGDYQVTRAGEIIRCPWHGWEFDIRTGQSWCDPARIRTRRYPVEVAPGAALVRGPYVAETVPVAVEQDYVVVEI